MARIKFTATILSGHKEDAVEVPFNPSIKWSLTSAPLRPGRRAYFVRCKINYTKFDGAVVARSRKHWLLLPHAIEKAAGVRSGDEVLIEMSEAQRDDEGLRRRRAHHD